MASIKRITGKNGTVYKITVSQGYDVQGKKMVKCTTFTPEQKQSERQQEKAAQVFAVEFENRVKNGESLEGEKMSFDGFAEKWLERVKNSVTYTTYKSYEMMLRTKIVPYFRTYKLSKIKVAEIEAFLLTMVDCSAQSSIKKYHMVLSRMFKTAMRWQIVDKNPCVLAEIPRSQKKVSGVMFFTTEQARMFLASLDMEFELTYKGHRRIDDTGKPYHVGDYIEKRGMPLQLKVFFYIAMTCGMRRGEILALHWNDLDFEKKTIKISKSVTKTADGVTCKEPKTATSVRTIPMPDNIAPLLTQYRCEYDALRASMGDKWQGDGNVFTQADGKLMGMHTPYQRFVSHIERYNAWVMRTNEELPEGAKRLEPLPRIPFHGLRHTCATLLNDMGTNISIISKILGHAQTSTTMNIYAHSFESQLREASVNMDVFLMKCTESGQRAER